MNSLKWAALAGLLFLATTALAQSEQWLEYHTGPDGRAYHSMQLTTNPPPGIVLPKLNDAALVRALGDADGPVRRPLALPGSHAQVRAV